MGDAGECTLLTGVIAYVAQISLFGFVLLGLFYKRYRETPKRPIKVWSMDVSKQVFSAGAAHLCNMAIAIVASIEIRGASECSWYFVVYTIDTTIGVTVTILLHKLAVHIAKSIQKRHRSKYIPYFLSEVPENEIRWFDYIAMCGNYGDPPMLKPWLWQISEWTLVTVLARFAIGGFIVMFKHLGLIPVAAWLDGLFGDRSDLLLMFVMVMCPVAMNMVQACVQDTVLKWRYKRKEAVSRPLSFVDSVELDDIEINTTVSGEPL